MYYVTLHAHMQLHLLCVCQVRVQWLPLTGILLPPSIWKAYGELLLANLVAHHDLFFDHTTPNGITIVLDDL